MPKAPPWKVGYVKPRPIPKPTSRPAKNNLTAALQKNIGPGRVTVKPVPTVNPQKTKTNLSPPKPKPTPQQTQTAFERTSQHDPNVIKAQKAGVAAGQAYKDKRGKVHWLPASPITTSGLAEEQPANTLSLGGLVDRVSRIAVGPNVTNAVEGKSFSPLGAGIETLGILPFGKIAKVTDVAEHVAQGIRAGQDANTILQGAKTVAKFGKVQERNLRFGPVNIRTAYSTSRSMRGVQKTLDANTRRIIKAGSEIGLAPHDAIAMAKGPSGKIARFHSGLLVRKADHYMNESQRAVAKMLGGVNLKPEQWTALKAVSKGIHPEQTIQNNLKLIANAEAKGDIATARRLAHDNKVLEDSKKYLKTVDAKNAHPAFPNHPEVQGKVVELRSPTGKDKALNKLWDTWGLLKRVSGEAEAAAIKRGDITPEQAFARIHEPGRIDLGASWSDKNNALLKAEKDLNDNITAQKRYAETGSTGISKSIIDLHKEEPILLQKWLALRNTGGGLVGHEDYLGGRIYYPSQEDSKYFRSGQYKTRSALLPYQTRGESSAAFKGVLQQTGRESTNIGRGVSRAALFRQSGMAADRKLAELRQIAMKGTVPVDARGALLKTYHGIRMEPQVPHLVQSDFLELGKKIDTGIPIAQDEARAAVNSFKSLRDFQLPATRRAAELGGEIGVIPKFLLGSLKDDRLLLPESWSKATRALASMSQLMKDMLVYSKFPGHIPPRLISNAIMAIPSSGRDFVPAALAFTKIAKNDKELSHWITTIMGRGYFSSYAETEAASRVTQKISSAVVKPIEFTADRFVRDSAFLAMARKAADNQHMTYSEFVKYLHGMRNAEPGTKEAIRLQHITQLASEAAGEYSRLSSAERNLLSNVLFLYRWVKASTIWTGRFALEHPVLAGGAAYGAYRAYDPNQPLYNRFGIPYLGGRGSIATSLPFSTPFEYAMRGGTMLQRGAPGFGESPLDTANPALISGIELLSGRDPVQGTAIKGNRLVGVGQAFYKQTPIGALQGGSKSIQDRIKKFIFGNLAPQSTTTTVQNISSAGTLQTTTNNLVKKGLMTPSEAAHIQSQLKNLEKRMPGIQAKVNSELKRLHIGR